MNKVRDYMYLGSCRAACNYAHLREIGITHIINTAHGMLRKFGRNWKSVPPGFHYLPIDLADKSSQSIAQHFEPCFDYIEAARREAGEGKTPKILIHCVQGKSRSVTIAIAYLMRKEGISVEEALNQIRAVRDVVHTPNRGFMRQLYKYERELGIAPARQQPGAVKARGGGRASASDRKARYRISDASSSDIKESRQPLNEMLVLKGEPGIGSARGAVSRNGSVSARPRNSVGGESESLSGRKINRTKTPEVDGVALGKVSSFRDGEDVPVGKGRVKKQSGSPGGDVNGSNSGVPTDKDSKPSKRTNTASKAPKRRV